MRTVTTASRETADVVEARLRFNWLCARREAHERAMLRLGAHAGPDVLQVYETIAEAEEAALSTLRRKLLVQ